MAVLKCKMCGGNLEVTEGQSYGTCDSCGSTMTLPRVDDERILNLFNRANHYRHQNEFDKALATYESILEDDTKNAEAHWGCVLSRYGIEYVEDGRTHERIPTCHRVQNESILADLDYQNALKYAPDNHSAELYKSEANRIAEIQKRILNIARNESPYDIFICYKETDESGKRTIDSTLAQDIYYQLTNEGYKVFFSRITLEDKLGQEYEPYIFAALNSAKVMLVIGTKQDYFNAVWVKNEWARFLALTKKDRSKLIIPCYRDIDAYELPDELSMFQSQDMSKIGFIQDLIRGINKVLAVKAEAPAPVPTPTAIVQPAHDYEVEAETLLKRAFMFLEDSEWNKANELLEKVLNINPENAKAYLGKLMIDVKVNKEVNLGACGVRLTKNPDYQKAIRFADNTLKKKLEQYDIEVKNKLNSERKDLLNQYNIEKSKLNSMPQYSYWKILLIDAVLSWILGIVGYFMLDFDISDVYYDWGEIMLYSVFGGFIIFCITCIFILVIFDKKIEKTKQQKLLINKLACDLYLNELNINQKEVGKYEQAALELLKSNHSKVSAIARLVILQDITKEKAKEIIESILI